LNHIKINFNRNSILNKNKIKHSWYIKQKENFYQNYKYNNILAFFSNNKIRKTTDQEEQDEIRSYLDRNKQ
jgi:hypothetical protein